MSPKRAEMLLRRVLVGLFVVSLSGATLRADAQSCGFTLDKTPSRAVDPALWSGLEPTERLNGNGTGLHPDRDTTEFDRNGAYSHNRPFWRSIDAAGGWVFGGYNLGLHLFDARGAKAKAPSLASSVRIENLPILYRDPHNFFVVNDVDAVDGESDLVLMTGMEGIGLVAVDTSNKSSPRVFYQDGGVSGTKVGQGVYATKIAGRYYGFLAAQVGTGAGVWFYDLSTALGGTCVEERPASVNCPGVFKSKLTSAPQSHVDGAGSDASGHFVVFSGGLGGSNGLEIWNLSQPNTPVKALTGFTDRRVDGVALWEQAGKLYLAASLRRNTANPVDQARIYDVTCLRTGCAGNPLSGSGLYDFPTPGSSGLTTRVTVSHSVSSGQHYLHVGRANTSNIDVLQAEWLLNVTDPSNPFDLAGGDPRNGNLGQPTMTVGGKTVGYWSWYQACSAASGSNHFEPADGIVADGYFYRAGSSILDVHKVMDVTPTLLVSVTPETTYTGTAVSAQATALNCTPLAGQWAWTASGGGVVTGSSNNVTIQWPTAGNKTVSVSNPGCAGASVTPKTVTVLTAAPAVGSVTSDVSSAPVCSQVTFTANDVTGKPPLQHSWQILDSTDAFVANLGSTQTAVWDTTGVTPGSYKARYTVSNSTPPPATKDSATVQIDELGPLGFSAPIGATVQFGTVTFAANATGATEWKWDFDDGTPIVATNDPVLGPAPSHTYEALGTYDVTVQIRNCVEGWQTSAVKQVVITELNPLKIVSFASGGPFPLDHDAGVPIPFTTTVIGEPDFYDYDWNGDGTFEDSGKAAPVQSHTYNTPGSYQPVLRIRKGAAEDVFQHAGVILVTAAVNTPPPSVSLSGPTSGTIGQSRTFSASASNCSPGTWSWQAGGGTITGSGASVSIVWATAGTKTVQATASGCNGLSASRNITITGSTGPQPLKAAFTSAPAAPKVGEAVSFDASGSTGNPVDYIWDFGDGSTGTGKQTTHTYTQAGARTVRLEVSKDDASCQFGVCTSVVTKTVTIGAGTPPGALKASFTSTPAAPKVGQAVSFDASGSTGNPVDYIWDFGDGSTGSGKQTTHTYTQPGVRTVTLEVSKDDPSCQFGVCTDVVAKTLTVESGAEANGCTGNLANDPDKLCLGEGRYIVEVDWDNYHSQTPHVGEGRFRRLGGSENTGFFWFFNPDSIDLIIKIIDGTVVNEHVWVFYGALTDVVYDLRVTDTLTNQTKSYKNLAGSICGRGDTSAFSTAGLTAPAAAATAASGGEPARATGEAITQELFLLDDRFKVTVDWENHHATPLQTGTGRSVQGTNGSGYFWFFEQSSLDLVVKMIDAREFDGHFWVFYGGLSDVKYNLRIEDQVTGQTWERVNPPGSICGGSDTAAFFPTGG